MMKLCTNFGVSYSQIYLEDLSCRFHDHNVKWDNSRIRDMVIVGSNYLIIGTVTSIVVEFSIEILEKEPDLDIQVWDHINICALNLSSGILVSGDIDDESEMLSVVVKDGKYGFYICYKDLDSASADGLSSNDSYHVFMWPVEEILEMRVLKQWERK